MRALPGLGLLGLASFVLSAPVQAAPLGGSVLATETARLSGQSPADNDAFSQSVAVSGETAIVGAPMAGIGGTASVFVRQGTTWVLQATLVSQDLGADDGFGYAVALEGDRAVVGAPFDDDTASASGSVYVFERTGTTWAQTAKLVASDPWGNGILGTALDLSGDSIAASAPNADVVGATYVFVRSGTTWSQEARLVASDGAEFDLYGHVLGLDGDVLAVGAPEESALTGAVYVYERSGTIWTETAKLLASDAANFNRFGESVTVSQGRIAAGAPGYVHGVGFTQGSAYVFAPSGTAWAEEVRLVASDGEFNDRLGEAIALDGDRLLVGAAQDTHGGATSAGSAYVFLRENGAWTERAKLVASDPELLDLFGLSVALDGRHAVAGALNADVGASNDGAAYAFELVVSQSFCDGGDGSLAACPCANPGSPDTGCDIAQATGGLRLDVLAQEVTAQNRATFAGSGFPQAASPTALVLRASTLDGAGPHVFGDGLRCIGIPVVRLAATFASGGVSTHTVGHAGLATTYYYQLWARNTPAMYCTPDAFNLSNGRTLDW